MAHEPSYLVDTNILLRLAKQEDPNYSTIQSAIESLTERGTQLCYIAQNIIEFWNVCTPQPTMDLGFQSQKPIPVFGRLNEP